ncbi:DUF4236 domain-containing protein [Cecembia calidifontis]|uniref:Uncharacterized protein DUF4236 n=1 Tax=Cecembia calidifontis TaxID=1187080 RepID=A0A4Q7P4H1_9BACT|nr:DUF4236 domain-containing protein [Cecembia calidifontis]RZS94883.1 uncharacterized protein DUF4236 [Cecembia calidifontis]
MGFYLRKGFNFGPLRVNLSKSGLGISAGVTGARIGINSQGRTYVHGGRHGLYYRKNLPIGNKSTSSSKGKTSNLSLEEEMFSDTGLTYKIMDLTRQKLVLEPLFSSDRKIYLYLGLSALLVGIFSTAMIFKLMMLLTGALMITWFILGKLRQKNLKKSLESLQGLSADQQTEANWIQNSQGLNQNDLRLLAIHTLDAWLENQVRDGQLIPLENLVMFLPIDREKALSLALGHYNEVVHSVLADHQLEDSENEFIESIEDNWSIPADEIQQERKLIDSFRMLRQIQQEELPLKSFSRDLVAGEKPYFEGEGRLLVLRVLDSWQANRVRYKTKGYQLDMEGIIRISSRVVEIHEGRNIRSYPIRQVEDVHLSLGEGIVEVFMSNRKQPLVFTAPDLFEFSAVLLKASGQN